MLLNQTIVAIPTVPATNRELLCVVLAYVRNAHSCMKRGVSPDDGFMFQLLEGEIFRNGITDPVVASVEFAGREWRLLLSADGFKILS